MPWLLRHSGVRRANVPRFTRQSATLERDWPELAPKKWPALTAAGPKPSRRHTELSFRQPPAPLWPSCCTVGHRSARCRLECSQYASLSGDARVDYPRRKWHKSPVCAGLKPAAAATATEATGLTGASWSRCIWALAVVAGWPAADVSGARPASSTSRGRG